MYEINKGQILIDDVDFMNYTKQEVRSNIGYVLQEPALFSGTIKSNIAFGTNATDEEVDFCAERMVSSFSSTIILYICMITSTLPL